MATPAATLEPARKAEEPPAPAVSTDEPDATYMTPNSVLAYSLAPDATQPAAGGEEAVPPPDLEQGGEGRSLPEQGEPQQSLPEQSSTEQTDPAPVDAEPLDLDRADAPPDDGSTPAQPAPAPGLSAAAPPPPPPPPAPPAAPPTQTPPAQPGAPSKGASGGSARGGGSGRGGGPGSAAAQPGTGAAGSGESAAATGAGAGADEAGGGADPLAAWKAAIGKRTDEISAPPLDGVAAAPGQLSSQAQATEQQRAGERPDFGADAKAVLPAAPQGPPPEEQLDTTAADAAIAAVDAAGRVKLSDQTFPAMAPIPAGMRAPPKPPPAVPSAPAADGPAAKVAPDGKPVDPKAKAVAGKVAGVVPGPIAKAGDKVVVSDPGTRAELAPLPAAQATLIGDVAARVLRDAPAHARKIVDGANATLDARKSVAELTSLAGSFLEAELAAITTELEGIAAAAGVSAGALQAKVAEQKKALEKQAAEGDAQLGQQATAATGAVAERRADEQQEIAGAGKAVRDEVDRKQAAAKGVADPTVINARRDTYLDTQVTTVAAGVARLRSAQERREADLRRVGDDQKAEYRRLARAEAAEIKAANTDETQGKIAARPVLDWGERQALEVDAVVQRLTREAGAEVKRHDADVRAAGETAREQIRDWAAERLGRERSWWDRLVDAFDDWTSQSKADTKAWEQQRDAESRDKVAADLTKLADLKTLLGKGNQAATTDALLRMSKEEQAVALAFLSGKEDALGAVASGLVARISSRRVPELGKQLEDKAIADLDWVTLDKVGAAQTPGFSAGEIVVDIRASVKGIGTDEKRLFEALEGRTRIQVAALRGAYKSRIHRDMDDDINSDVVGSEQDRVDALLSGDPTKAAVATLRDAVSGAGTDEATIMRTLRGKTPAERDAIIAAYEETYHVTLRADLVADMEGNELGQADALLAGDTDKADAMALREAMQGDGTDEDAITGVYAQIRTEVEATARAKGMTTAEVDAEIKRRNAAVTVAYGTAFAHGSASALEADFRTELSYGELNLALAQKSGDQTAVDVAKLEIEHQGVYTADEKVNDVLKAQEARAKKEVMRDLLVAFDAKAATMTPEERKAAMEKLEAEAETEATKRAKVLMGKLTTGYDAAVGHGAFDRLLTDELSDNWLTGYAGTEARERVASGGKLSDAKELKFAILGVGTNKKAIRDALKGKSKEEIAKIKQEYAAATGGNDLLADLHGDLGGRDEADMTILLETGDSTPEERMENFRRRKEWELTEGVGDDGKAAVAEEERILSETSVDAEAAYAEYRKLKATPGADPAKTQAALGDFERLMGYGDKDIERHREELDSATDTAAMVGATVVGLAVSIATLGTATPVVAAILGAVAATATTMSIKIGMKGGAYSGEEAAVDLAQGTADALLAIATAGWGEAIVKVLARNMPAVAALTHAAETGLLARITTKGLESAIEGGITGFPSGAWGAILDEGTWRSSDPLGVILKAGGAAAGQGAAMGAVTGAGMDAAFGGPLTPGGHATRADTPPPPPPPPGGGGANAPPPPGGGGPNAPHAADVGTAPTKPEGAPPPATPDAPAATPTPTGPAPAPDGAAPHPDAPAGATPHTDAPAGAAPHPDAPAGAAPHPDAPAGATRHPDPPDATPTGRAGDDAAGGHGTPHPEDASAAPGATEAETPVKVGEAQHEVKLRNGPDGPEVWACSDVCGPLLGKLDAMLGHIQEQTVRTKLEQLKAEVDALQNRVRAGEVPDAAERLRAVRELGDKLNALGATHPQLGVALSADWAASTLDAAAAAELLNAPAAVVEHLRAPATGEGIMPEVALALVRAVPAADLAAITPAISPDHLAELLHRLGPAGLADAVHSQIELNDVPSLATKAARLAAGEHVEFAAPPAPVGPTSKILDNNVMTALRMVEVGGQFGVDPNLPPVPGFPRSGLHETEQVSFNRLAAMADQHRPPGSANIGPFDLNHQPTPADAARIRQILDIRTPNAVIAEGDPMAGSRRGAPLDVDRSTPEYKAAMADMRNTAIATEGEIGELVGGMDRAVVADAIFASHEPGVMPELLTADHRIFARLIPFATSSPIVPPKSPGKNTPGGSKGKWPVRLALANPGGFVIELPSAPGRKLLITPIVLPPKQ